MSGRGRRFTVIFAIVAIVLTVGRWGSVFLTERLWEASVSEAVAQAGTRRALYSLLLEFAGLLIAVVWCVTHLTIAAGTALPDRAPPEREGARLWPSKYPRWWLTAAGVVLGLIVGDGAGEWLQEVQLLVDGVRFGVPDPLLGVDLGFFLRDFPLWSRLQSRLVTLAGVALGGALLLHIAGGALRIVEHRLWVSPKVRGHLAVLLATLAVGLAGGAALEPFRLAAGLRGPLLPSEFLLRTLVAEIEAGLGAAAALISLLWWVRVRGVAALIAWILFGVSLITGKVLPLGAEKASADEGWQKAGQSLDSIAFALPRLERKSIAPRTSGVSLRPTLWDDQVLAAAPGDSTLLRVLGRGWVSAGGQARPVWFALREATGRGGALVAVSDDEVSPAGGPLAWRAGDSTPSPGWRAFQDLPAQIIRPGAPPVEADSTVPGVVLDRWPRRLVLAWALQRRAALSAPSGTRLGWRIDPVSRLRGAAPFAYWTAPRAHPTPGGLVWTSDGLLTSTHFPASSRIVWNGASASMVRPAFLGVVDAVTGVVQIFQRDSHDSLSAAWRRIAAPLIQPADGIPAHLLRAEGYPEELLLAQARVLEGPAWHAGKLDRPQSPGNGVPPLSPGGAEALVPYVNTVSRGVSALLLARRTPTGDSLGLTRFTEPNPIESESVLLERWKRLPFTSAITDSVKTSGSAFVLGRVRIVPAEDGVVAYQPAWGVAASGKAQLVLVNLAMSGKLGTGRSFDAAWRNFRAEISPISVGAGSDAILEAARGWMRHADSALKRGDLQELGRALEFLRELLDRPKRP